jgi:hypothetical protein
MAEPVIRVGPSMRISFDEGKLRKAEQELAGIRNGMARAISGAINKTLRSTKTQTANELYALLTAKRGNILRRIFNTPSSPQTLRGSTNIQLRQIALVNFKHKEKRKKKKWGTAKSGTGVVVQIYKNGPGQRFPHAFIATGRRDQADGAGNKHIFQRVSNAAGKRVARFPLVSLKGVSLMKEFEKRPDMRRRVQDHVAARMDKELDSQVDFLLKRPKAFRNA